MRRHRENARCLLTGLIRASAPCTMIPAAAVLAGGALASSSVAARPVPFPRNNPEITMNVPDDWSVAYTAFGLEITSPEKKLYIVADVLPRNKPEADGWAKKALNKMETFGVTFQVKGAAPKALVSESRATASPSPPTSLSSSTSPSQPTSPSRSTNGIAPTSPPSSTSSDVATATKRTASIDRSAPTFTFLNPPREQTASTQPTPDLPPVFSGTPSLGTPARSKATLAVRSDVPDGVTLEEMAKPTIEAKPKLPFRVGAFPKATLNGERIDVQIVNFTLGPKRLFLLLQASLSSDFRAVAVINSVKPAS